MVLFNPLGNLLLLGGFGNLRGNMEIWDVSGKKKAAQFEANDTTDVSLASIFTNAGLFCHFSLNSRQSKLKKLSNLKNFSPKIRIFFLNSREILNFPHQNERIFC